MVAGGGSTDASARGVVVVGDGRGSTTTVVLEKAAVALWAMWYGGAWREQQRQE